MSKTCVECGLRESETYFLETCESCRTKERDEEERKPLLNRCSRAEGQIRGIRNMIERDAYCDDILTQIAATQSALRALSRQLLEQHIKSCLADRIKDGDETATEELMDTINRMMK